MKICKLCQNTYDKLSKSHIIPRAFYPSQKKQSSVEAYTDADFSRRLRMGLYDSEILCAGCEKIISTYDDYAVSLLRDRNGAENLYQHKNKEGFIVFKDLNYQRIRGFLASLIWRFSLSQQKEIKPLSAGEKYEQIIATDILNSGDFDYIDVLVCFLNDDEHEAFLAPKRERFNPKIKDRGVANGWRIWLPNIMLLVKIDKRENPYTVFVQLPDTKEKLSTSLAYFHSGYNIFMAVQVNSIEHIKDMMQAIVENNRKKGSKINLLPKFPVNQSVFKIISS